MVAVRGSRFVGGGSQFVVRDSVAQAPAPCRSTRVVESVAWDRTPVPPLGALLVRTKGPGP